MQTKNGHHVIDSGTFTYLRINLILGYCDNMWMIFCHMPVDESSLGPLCCSYGNHHFFKQEKCLEIQSALKKYFNINM